MEEPLERTNAARAVVRREGFDSILDAFKSAAKETDREKPRAEKWLGELRT